LRDAITSSSPSARRTASSKCCSKRPKTIFEELGSLTPVLRRRLNNLQERGIKRRSADATIKEIEAEDPATAERQTSAEELEEARERGSRLNRQLGELETIFENSKKNLGFEAAQFRQSPSTSGASSRFAARPHSSMQYGWCAITRPVYRLAKDRTPISLHQA
jgi:hypothetical protein